MNNLFYKHTTSFILQDTMNKEKENTIAQIRQKYLERLQELHQLYLDNLGIWEGEEFTKLESNYKHACENWQSLIDNARSRSVRTTITKGEIIDVFPFENEQYGNKTNGKQIPEVVMDNDCYIHHFDQEGRLILKENMSEFLSAPYYFSLYHYHKDSVEYIYGAINSVYRYQLFILSDIGEFVRNLTYAKEGKLYEYYYHENGRIVKSELHQIQNEQNIIHDYYCQYDYLYDKKDTLQLIHRTDAHGGMDTTYSLKKINFKKLEQRIFEEMKSGMEQFMDTHKGEQFTRFAIAADSPHSMYLYIDTSADPEYLQYPADWKYTEIVTVDLIDHPLDDQQTEKLMDCIAKSLIALLNLDMFSELIKNQNFKALLFDHQGFAKEMYKGVDKLLQNKIYCIK